MLRSGAQSVSVVNRVGHICRSLPWTAAMRAMRSSPGNGARSLKSYWSSYPPGKRFAHAALPRRYTHVSAPASILWCSYSTDLMGTRSSPIPAGSTSWRGQLPVVSSNAVAALSRLVRGQGLMQGCLRPAPYVARRLHSPAHLPGSKGLGLPQRDQCRSCTTYLFSSCRAIHILCTSSGPSIR